MDCPFCQAKLKPLGDARFAACAQDRVVINLAYETTSYEHDYFDKEYRTQYGKSYTADHAAILKRNRWRAEHLRPFISAESHPEILEVGSAAGYFLKIMQEADFSVRGWEISQAMSKYANARGLKTVCQDFLKGARAHEKRKSAPFDVLALFYVLEHLPDQADVWRHLNRLVKPGGYLALALPSVAGPTYRFHRANWYVTHPKDHAIDYSPQSLKQVGRQFGFEFCGAWSEGIHPERFPWGGNKLMGSLYSRALQHAPLGDTIFAILKRS